MLITFVKMYLKDLSIINFKNYEEAAFSFSEKVNCFVGDNGEGKTNLLDAIHYLSICKSYFTSIDTVNIKHEQPFFVIQGNFVKGEDEDEIYCGLKKGDKKRFKRNKKEYKRLIDHVGRYPSVMISPYDADLINSGSDVRRKFLDAIISQFDKEYLEALVKYNKSLQQRNALLKRFNETNSFNEDSLEVWDMQLVDSGVVVHEKRKEFLEGFIPLFQKYYEYISGAKEEVGIRYDSQLEEGAFQELLLKARKKDRMATYTTVGIHKDDLLFEIDGYPVKRYGSQGQQKSFLVALKLAKYYYFRKEKGLSPILLLDDIFDKLDEGRVQKLLDLVMNEDFGQVFITDTDEIRMKKVIGEHEAATKLFRIKKGEVTEL